MNNDAGDIKMKRVAVQSLVLINESGYQLIEGLSADKGELTTNDGELQLKDSSLNELTVTSSSGDSYITGVTSPVMAIRSKAGKCPFKRLRKESCCEPKQFPEISPYLIQNPSVHQAYR